MFYNCTSYTKSYKSLVSYTFMKTPQKQETNSIYILIYCLLKKVFKLF